MEKQTPAFGKIYTVTSPAGCTVTDAQTLKLLQTCAAGVQTPFVACGPSVIISDDSALVAGPFDFARVPLGSSGGAGAPLTPDQLTALENAVGGKLENVSIVPQEETKATGWISSPAWSEIADGAELFQINGTPFFNLVGTSTDILAASINETLGGLVTATAADANTINLESHNAGATANSITLSTADPRIFLSGDTLTGGQDEVKSSVIFWVDNEGIHFSNIPENAVLYTNGMKINTMGGDVYHGDGSASFTEKIGDDAYNSVIDAHHFEARRNGDLKVHLHADYHGNAVLELNGARVLSQPLGTLVEGVDTKLQHNGFYVFDSLDGDFNLAMLSVASAPDGVTTARIAIIIPKGARDDALQLWPTDWNWLEGAAPQLESGKMHFVSVERFEIYTNAHLSHSNPL